MAAHNVVQFPPKLTARASLGRPNRARRDDAWTPEDKEQIDLAFAAGCFCICIGIAVVAAVAGAAMFVIDLMMIAAGIR